MNRYSTGPTPRHPELQPLIDVAKSEMAIRHGVDPATRLQAAAHEAGHVVMATALGEVVTGARIFSSQGRWGGSNTRNTITNPPTLLIEDPLAAIAAVCNNLAGYGGEFHSNCHHPSSSIDEKLRAEQILLAFSVCINIHYPRLRMMSLLLVGKTITCNHTAFEVVRNHLFEHRRLLRRDARRMLRSVPTIPVFCMNGEDRRRPEVFLPLLQAYIEN